MSHSSPNPPDHNDETAHQDDAVIGKAFRGSAIVLVLVIVVVVGTIFYLKRPAKKGPEIKTAIEAPVVPDRPMTQMPEVVFTDVTAAAGIDFQHNNGASGDKLLPESLGGGVAFFDYDNDGDADLLLVNSTWWDWDLQKNPDLTPTTSALYRNDTGADGEIKFTNVTKGSGIDIAIYGMGATVGDIDNDGFADIYLTCVGENKLFRNLGNGTFEDISESSATAGTAADWGTAAAFFDYDNDGRLDLIVANYVKWSREIDFQVNFTIDGTHRAYGPPTDFEGAAPRLYHNDGNGRFSDVSEASGVMIKNRATGLPAAKSLGIAPIDINRDGRMDVIIANDTVPNFLFINQGDGTFKEIGAISGVAYDSNGNTRGAMGIDTAQHRNNEDLGIAIGNFANEMTALYVSQGQPLLFSDEAIAEGIGPASRLPLKFGIFFFDYDLDGWQDLLTVNGHLDEDITKVQASQEYRQPAQLFWNNGGNGFLEVTSKQAGNDLFQPIVGRGSAFADVDLDGDLDFILTQLHGPPLLLRNDQALGHHWVRVSLVGSASNPDAVGAVVRVTAGGVTQVRQVMPTRSYLSSSERPLTFGLGDADSIESITITWPGGTESSLPSGKLKLDTAITISE